MWLHPCIFVAVICSFWTSVSGSSSSNGGGVLDNCTLLMGAESRACYVCMGRDQYNCEWGFTCCEGPCFKLVDDNHDIVAKGCASKGTDEGYDSKANVELTDSKLPWESNEAIQGQQFYCDSGDYCNTGSSLQRGFSLSGLVSSIAVLVFSVFVLKF